MADEKESFTEKILRSVLISSKGGVPLQKLNYEFKDLVGQDIPYRDHGCKTLEAYLLTLPRVCQIRREGGQVLCMGVANEETKHVDRLVKKQKATKKKSKPARLPRFGNHRGGGRGGRGGWARKPPPPRNFRAPPPQQQPPARRGGYNNNGPPRGGGGRGAGGQRSWGQPQPQGQLQGRWGHDQYEPQHKGAMPQRGPPPPSDVQRNQRPASNTAQNQRNTRTQPQQRPLGQQSSYEMPPRFRRQIHSTGSTGSDHQETPPPAPRSHSTGEEQPVSPGPGNGWDTQRLQEPHPVTRQQPQEPPATNQPPPVNDKVVTWVSKVLSEKTGGLWMSGLKKLYKEEFQDSLTDDVIDRLSRLSLWTAEEIGFSNDSILYPYTPREDSFTLSTADLRSRENAPQDPTRVAGNDKILYPKLQIQITNSPESGKRRRNVSSHSADGRPSSNTVPALVLPDEEELWDVYISYVISVVDFYCILIGDETSERLCALEDEMRDFYKYENEDWLLSQEPAIAGLYAAQLGEDWLRVKIIAVKDQQAGCFLVDHGDIESIPLEDLREIDPIFCELAFQAISCKLHGLERQAANNTATTRFCNTSLGQTRLAEVIDRNTKPLSLTLYKENLNINYLCALGDVL